MSNPFEVLMRSRYAAYASGEADYLFRTWHPRTRPVNVIIDADIAWRSRFGRRGGRWLYVDGESL